MSWDDGASYDGGFSLNEDGMEREISPISESSDLRGGVAKDDGNFAKSPPPVCRPCSENEENDDSAKGKTINLQKGDSLNARYVVVGVLGSGAFGTVYSARDQGSGEIVAVKVQRAGRKYSQVPKFAFPA